MTDLNDLAIKPNTLGPDGQPLFRPGQPNVPVVDWEYEEFDEYEKFGPSGEDLEPDDPLGDEGPDLDLPCGCGGS